MKILLADDHALFLAGMKNLLNAHGFDVAGVAHDGLEAIELARLFTPDVVLMDVRMPGINGLAATRILKSEMPQIKVVILTMQEDDDSLFEAIKSGASGYLLKSEEADSFLAALLSVTADEAPLSAGLAARIMREFGAGLGKATVPLQYNSLSSRQMEVLTLVASGLTYKEVAQRLNLTERTIKYHMGEIVQRLQVKNKADVIKYAQRSGLPGLKR